MKNVIAFLCVVFISAGIVAFKMPQTENVPQVVKIAFAKKFPTAKKIDWKKESSSEWEAEFKMDKTEYSANFSAEGKWLETEHEVSIKEIPKKIKAILDSKFIGYKIEESEISEIALDTVYEFEIEKGEESLEVAIDSNGKVVKKEVLEEKD